MRKSSRGSITVLMSAILAGVVLLVFVLADVTGIYIFEQNNFVALNSALKSVLAGYDETLAADYGIYGIDTKSTANFIAADFYKYYSANLKGMKGQKAVITECRLNGFESVMSTNSTEASILQYMKYRSPIYLAEGLIQNININGTVANTAGFAENVKSLAGSLGDIKDKTQILGELADLLNIGKMLLDLQIIKTAIKSDSTEISPEWLIVPETRSSASEYDADVFQEMTENQAPPDLNESAGFFKKLSEVLVDCRDTLYVASYVTEKFNCYGGGLVKTVGERFFDGGEIEYIIFGSNKKADNVSKAMDRMYLMRFLINTCDAFVKYKDYDPRAQLILSIISGALGASDEIVRLFSGEEISLAPGFGYLKLDYKDHLMMLLLMELAFNKQGVIERIQNLIQVNMIQDNADFRMGNYSASIRCDATVVLDTAFLKFAGFRKYVSKKQVYKGYH